jgi:hypothetical protein
VLPLDKAKGVFGRMQRYPDYGLYIAEARGQSVETFASLIMDNVKHVSAPSGVVKDVAVDRAWQK